MPSAADILKTLETISREWLGLAVAWHILLAMAVMAIILGWRPSRKAGAAVLVLPLLSVSALAWLSGNPFNGIVFLLFAILLALLGLRLPLDRVDPAPVWARAAGAVLIAFGWVYPHFLDGGSLLRYLYAAPTGLIPCPTLSVLVGFTLLANGFSSRAYSLSLGFLGIFYGAFGAFRLGVRIDLVLFIGSVVLMALAQMMRSHSQMQTKKS
ncbi:MAG: hypothetical protein ACM32H_03460 [Candidatus Aminicenantes bacterium RBG_16_66_30]